MKAHIGALWKVIDAHRAKVRKSEVVAPASRRTLAAIDMIVKFKAANRQQITPRRLLCLENHAAKVLAMHLRRELLTTKVSPLHLRSTLSDTVKMGCLIDELSTMSTFYVHLISIRNDGFAN